jgi:hypothetical protein
MSAAVTVRLATLIVGLALVASVTEWGLKLVSQRTPTEPLVVLPAAQLEPASRQTDIEPLARLLGSTGGVEATGMRALGIMADAATGRGIAVIAVDGQPTRAYRTGQSVLPGVTLVEVHKDRVVLSRAGVLQELRVPTKSAPAAPAPPLGGR